MVWGGGGSNPKLCPSFSSLLVFCSCFFGCCCDDSFDNLYVVISKAAKTTTKWKVCSHFETKGCLAPKPYDCRDFKPPKTAKPMTKSNDNTKKQQRTNNSNSSNNKRNDHNKRSNQTSQTTTTTTTTRTTMQTRHTLDYYYYYYYYFFFFFCWVLYYVGARRLECREIHRTPHFSEWVVAKKKRKGCFWRGVPFGEKRPFACAEEWTLLSNLCCFGQGTDKD